MTGAVKGEVTLPGSKSIALRQLAIAALTDGTTVVHGIPACDDSAAMLDCLAALGVTIADDGDALRLRGPMDFSSDVELDARMSGASTRLLLGLAALRSGSTRIDGHPSLRARTNAPLLQALAANGCKVESANGCLPVTLQGPLSAPAEIAIDGSLSSQYISALLIAAPRFSADRAQRIRITGELVSRPYIDITLNEMAKRGVRARWLSDALLEVPAGAYQPGAVQVEGDATAATYFAALATLHGGDITITNLGAGTCQGDYQFMEIMEQLGATVQRTEHSTRVIGPQAPGPLPPIDMSAMPDAALTLMTLAVLLPRAGRISGLSSLHHKECDRLECPAHELRQMGVNATTLDDAIDIVPASADRLRPHTLNTYHDHRMAMAFSLIGSATGQLRVDDKQVVDKTYPAYWKDYLSVLA